MIYILSILILVLLYLKVRTVFDYIPLSRKAYLKLKNEVSAYMNIDSSKFILSLLLIITLVLFLSYYMELRYQYWPILIGICIIMYPYLWLWRVEYFKQELYFNNLVNYLQHFIACYKNIPLTYHSLKECKEVFTKDMQGLIETSIQEIELGRSVNEALKLIEIQYNHFIVSNMHSLVSSVELYGAVNYLESLELILSDTDDLIEDISLFKQQQAQLKNRLFILIGFSVVLAIMVKYMISQINIQTDQILYQYSILIFLIIILITYVFSIRINKQSWILQGELV